MEAVKAEIPEVLRRMIEDSTTADLPDTGQAVFSLFRQYGTFHRSVIQLARNQALCAKSEAASLESKQLGNDSFSSGDYTTALKYYTEALRTAPMEAFDGEKNLVAILYCNRATVLHRMNFVNESLRDCTRAIQISPSYAKAWFRRGKANISLGNYKDAIYDLKVALSMESSSGGKKQIESELRSISHQYEGTSSVVQIEKNGLDTLDETPQIKLQLDTTPDKGRGMITSCDISPASLVHREDPYAMIILKQCRETHCHYCLNDLPPDAVPCGSCSIPLYCSQECQLKAGGQMFKINPEVNGILKCLPSDLVQYASGILGNDTEHEVEDIPEHKHECQGLHWSKVLPSEIVLAGRVLAKFYQKNRYGDNTDLVESLGLVHSYSDLPPDMKLDLHIYAIVLLYCLRHFCMFFIGGNAICQVVTLFSQIKVNCITVVRMRSIDAHGSQDQFGKPLASESSMSNVEQVRVGKAIYRGGSLFNHSCQPNVIAYFLSRTLYIRTTKAVAASSQLELSYGPQVGLWDGEVRHGFLKKEYSFQCHCSACSKFNLSDIVLGAFHCISPDCSGVVLDIRVAEWLKKKINYFPSCEKVDKKDDSYKICRRLFNQNFGHDNIQPGYCLKCGSYCDLKSSCTAVDESWKCVRRLQDEVISKEFSDTISAAKGSRVSGSNQQVLNQPLCIRAEVRLSIFPSPAFSSSGDQIELTLTISEALNSLRMLRSYLHPYNKKIAQAEDSLAQAFFVLGESQLAMDHFKASLLILEKLYEPDDIVIAFELLKLCSIQIFMGDNSALQSINRICDIFSCHYGRHAHSVFPYIQHLIKHRELISEGMKDSMKAFPAK